MPPCPAGLHVVMLLLLLAALFASAGWKIVATASWWWRDAVDLDKSIILYHGKYRKRYKRIQKDANYWQVCEIMFSDRHRLELSWSQDELWIEDEQSVQLKVLAIWGTHRLFTWWRGISISIASALFSWPAWFTGSHEGVIRDQISDPSYSRVIVSRILAKRCNICKLPC